jgi:large subunit ribosomal protein L9e
MKILLKQNTMQVPEGITCDIKARVVTVKGPRGTLSRSFKHMPIDLSFTDESKREIKLDRWFTSGKANATIRTCTSHIDNMFTGVTKGFQYKMRFVYAHFPINVAITNNKKRVEIRNFLGEKVIRIVDSLGDVTVERSTDVKDEIVLSGTDIDAVSRTAARVQNICAVKRKDIRKFLDGIYVSRKGNIVEE